MDLGDLIRNRVTKTEEEMNELKDLARELHGMHKELCDVHEYPYPEATYARVRKLLNG